MSAFKYAAIVVLVLTFVAHAANQIINWRSSQRWGSWFALIFGASTVAIVSLCAVDLFWSRDA